MINTQQCPEEPGPSWDINMTTMRSELVSVSFVMCCGGLCLLRLSLQMCLTHCECVCMELKASSAALGSSSPFYSLLLSSVISFSVSLCSCRIILISSAGSQRPLQVHCAHRRAVAPRGSAAIAASIICYAVEKTKRERKREKEANRKNKSYSE